MIFTLVTGPPCSGKSTFVQRSRGELDVVVDLDVLAVALGSPAMHDHESVYVSLAIEARLAILRRLFKRGANANVWYLSCSPSLEEQLHLPHVMNRVVMTTTREQCQQWALEAGRPETYRSLIDKWFADPAPGVTA